MADNSLISGRSILSGMSLFKNHPRTRSSISKLISPNQSLDRSKSLNITSSKALPPPIKNESFNLNKSLTQKPKKSKQAKTKKKNVVRRPVSKQKAKKKKRTESDVKHEEDSDTEIILNKSVKKDGGVSDKAIGVILDAMVALRMDIFNLIEEKEIRPKKRAPKKDTFGKEFTHEEMLKIQEKIERLTPENRRSLKNKFRDVCFSTSLNQFELRLHDAPVKIRREIIKFIDKLLTEQLKKQPGIAIQCAISQQVMHNFKLELSSA
jgi:hypothetical protein